MDKDKDKKTEEEEFDVGDINIGALLEELVKKALEQKASDIHIEPQEKETIVRYRIDGILHAVRTIKKEIESALIFKIKVASKLRTDEHFAPQDGRIRFEFGDKPLNTRISILPTSKGEKVVMRLLTEEGKSFALADLGFRPQELEALEKNYVKPFGMIVATGPTGSGKTTTLYAILKILNSPEKNVTTIEDPVEYDIEGVNHVHVNPKADLTFSTGLRSILRQDPDIMMVGEIRDNETARIAVNSAMTGHLVLSTIHTNDAITTIPRFVDMGVEPYLVAATLNLIIAQRLARKLCENCKKKEKITKEKHDEISRFRKDIATLLKVGDEMHVAVGCDKCSNGYKGRVGLYEVLELNREMRESISSNTNTDNLYELARKQGFKIIVEDGVEKIKEGLLDVSELIRVTALRE